MAQDPEDLAPDEPQPVDLDELAGRVRMLLENNPHLTTNLLASQLDAKVGDVFTVLDEYLCHEDGLQRVGPGQGGGWVPEIVPEFEPVELGYRWPDGSLKEIPFDLMNAEHRDLMGIVHHAE